MTKTPGQIACPRPLCGAGAGNECVTRNGNVTTWHAARWDASNRINRLYAVGLAPCGCMLEDDPTDGVERVMTHSSTCSLHPEYDGVQA